MKPVAFDLGGLTIYWYGVLVAVGFLAGIWTASRRAPRVGVAAERMADLGPWLILGALVGARLLYVATYWQEDFRGHPWYEIFMIRKGGLVFYGGFIGAAAACVFYCRARALPLWKTADILAPSIALGYFFGRLGCLMNGCCYGRACSLPWAIHFPYGHETYPHALHPSQLYEALAGLVLYGALAWLYRRRRFDGQVFAVYLLAYAASRFSVEFFRGDDPVRHLGGWATAGQVTSLLIFAAGATLLWWRATAARRSPIAS